MTTAPSDAHILVWRALVSTLTDMQGDTMACNSFASSKVAFGSSAFAEAPK